ncbi:MAG: SpoIIE family protein phosphatase [Bryobacteraceae bacterium]
MSSDYVPREVVNAALRTSLPFFAIACVCLLVGVCALLLARIRSRDPLLAWVGLFSVLYAIRLLVENEAVRAAFNAPGPGFRSWTLCITYAINVPYALFVRELFGRGWKGVFVIMVWLYIAFAIVAIPTAFTAPQPHWTDLMNHVLVVSGTLLVLVHALIARRAGNALAASLLWPLAIFCVFILLENKGVRPAGLDVEPIGFLTLLGGLASIAARRALATERKLNEVEQELSTARRIQSSIIPQSPPALKGIHVATRYEPMTSVAGDFYDFLTSSDNLLTILVADVSGHGVPAALVACMLKVCFAAQKNKAADPAAILSGLGLMLRGSLGGQYVTAVCASIDTRTHTLTYASAGHPPILLARTETDELVLLSENGLFIGPFPDATYVNGSVVFRSGDRVLLYTDGITEATDASGEEFGRERLGQFLLHSNGSEPVAILERLFEHIATDSQQDDLTAILVRLD